MQVSVEQVSYPLNVPIFVGGQRIEETSAVRVTIADSETVFGRGEGVCDLHKGETPQKLIDQIEKTKPAIEQGATRLEIQSMMGPGGARNAVDCAFWDLEASLTNQSIWERLGLEPHALRSHYSIGSGSPAEMAFAARHARRFGKLKLHLGATNPMACVQAVRSERPDAQLLIDAKQTWTFNELQKYEPICRELGVELIEQPLDRDSDSQLIDYKGEIPICADESCISSEDFERTSFLYHYINIQLDKVGGLTEGLKIRELAHRSGMGLMVGNLMGSSLNIAAHLVLGQYCHFVDVDGPLFLQNDVEPILKFHADFVTPSEEEAWGSSVALSA